MAPRGNFPLFQRGKVRLRRWRRGAVAQLGERRNGIAKVRGSIPLGSTTFQSLEPRRSAASGASGHASASGTKRGVADAIVVARSSRPAIGRASHCGCTCWIRHDGGWPALHISGRASSRLFCRRCSDCPVADKADVASRGIVQGGCARRQWRRSGPAGERQKRASHIITRETDKGVMTPQLNAKGFSRCNGHLLRIGHHRSSRATSSAPHGPVPGQITAAAPAATPSRCD